MTPDIALVLSIILPLMNMLFCATIRRTLIVQFSTVVISFAELCISSYIFIMSMTSNKFSFVVGNFSRNLGIEIQINPLNGFLLLFIAFYYFCTSILWIERAKDEINNDNIWIFNSLLSASCMGLSGIAISNDLFNIFVFIEISSLSAYALTAIGKDRYCLVAAIEYLISMAIGSSFYLIGVAILYHITGALNISEIRNIVGPIKDISSLILIGFSCALMSSALLIKSAIFPAHIWLTRVYSSAIPTFCAYTSSITAKIYIFTLIKVLFFTIGNIKIAKIIDMREMLIISSLLCIPASCLLASCSINIRHLIANSSVAQASYLVLLICLDTRMSISGAVVQSIAHAFSTFTIFSLLGVFKSSAYKDLNNENKGTYSIYSVIGVIIAVCSMAGIPGTIGFVGKLYLFQSLVEKSMWHTLALVSFYSFLSFLYCSKVIFEFTCFQNISYKSRFSPSCIPIFICSVLTVVFGVYNAPVAIVSKKIGMYVLYFSR